MSEVAAKSVYVFNGPGSAFPSGVFPDRVSAEDWIFRKKLTGTLTEYPVGIGVFDWAVASGKFAPKRPEQSSPGFIERFTSIAQWHLHYEDGVAQGAVEKAE